MDVELGNVVARTDAPLDLTFVWRYLQGPNGGAQDLITKTVTVSSDVSVFVYTLTGPDGGYPAGTYEVITFLETDTAYPIRREFIVE